MRRAAWCTACRPRRWRAARPARSSPYRRLRRSCAGCWEPGPPRSSAMDQRRSRALILLVDDSQTQALVMSQALQSAGFRSRVAHNGVEALEEARKWRPDLIISDVLMPEMDGFALC